MKKCCDAYRDALCTGLMVLAVAILAVPAVVYFVVTLPLAGLGWLINALREGREEEDKDG